MLKIDNGFRSPISFRCPKITMQIPFHCVKMFTIRRPTKRKNALSFKLFRTKRVLNLISSPAAKVFNSSFGWHSLLWFNKKRPLSKMNQRMDLMLTTVYHKSYTVALWPESGLGIKNYLLLIKIQLHLMAFLYSNEFLLFLFCSFVLWTYGQLTDKQKKRSCISTSFGVCIHLLY